MIFIDFIVNSSCYHYISLMNTVCMKTVQMFLLFFSSRWCIKSRWDSDDISAQADEHSISVFAKEKKRNHSATTVVLCFFLWQFCWHQIIWGCKSLSPMYVIQGFSVFQICTFSFFIHFRRQGVFVWQPYLEICWRHLFLDLWWTSQKLQLLGFYSTLKGRF